MQPDLLGLAYPTGGAFSFPAMEFRMPYGIAKKYGGDSKRNDAKMEKQVKAIMKSGQSKKSAIKIAKAQMSKRRGK